MNDNYKSFITAYQEYQNSIQKIYNSISPVCEALQSVVMPQVPNFTPALQDFQQRLSIISNQINPSLTAAMNSWVEQIQPVLLSMFPDGISLTARLQETCAQMNNVMLGIIQPETLNQALKNMMAQLSDIQPAFNSVNITDEYVDIPDAIMPEISKNLNTSDLDFVEEVESPTGKVHRFNIKEFFILYVFPILLTAVQMTQNAYYHNIDVLNEQQSQLEEAAYQEQMLQLATKYTDDMELLNETMDEILEYLQDNSESPTNHSETQVVPHLSEIVQESAPENQISDSVSADVSENPDTSSLPD